MTINLSVPQTMQELRPRITVIGVGGAGCNAVNNMIDANLEGVDFLVANTDGQSLAHSMAPRKMQLGSKPDRRSWRRIKTGNGPQGCRRISG